MKHKTKNIIKIVYLTRISCPRVPSIADSIALRGLCACHPVAAAVVVVVKGCRGSRWKIGDCSNVDAVLLYVMLLFIGAKLQEKLRNVVMLCSDLPQLVVAAEAAEAEVEIPLLLVPPVLLARPVEISRIAE